MTAVAAPEDSRHAADRPAVEDRGTLHVHPTVVRKIVERTAGDTAGTVTVARRVAGIGAGHHGPGAKVSDRGDALDIALDVAVRYPASVSELYERLRSRVADEVHRVTGRQVRRVAVTVSALLPDTGRRVE